MAVSGALVFHKHILLELLLVLKCCNLRGVGVFSCQSEFKVNIFAMLRFWKYFFCTTAFVDEIIRGNIKYNLFYQLVVNIGKYLLKKRKSPRKISRDLRHSLFSRILPFLRQIFPHINHKLMKQTLLYLIALN